MSLTFLPMIMSCSPEVIDTGLLKCHIKDLLQTVAQLSRAPDASAAPAYQHGLLVLTGYVEGVLQMANQMTPSDLLRSVSQEARGLLLVMRKMTI